MTALFSKTARVLLASLLAGCSLTAIAQTKVEDAWVRTSVPGQPSSGAFMRVTADSDSKLLSVQSPVAKTVQIHQSTMKDDVMSMRQVESVVLPAGKPVSFDPHGYHIMLIDLTAQVQEGSKVPLTLIVENAKGEKETIEVQAEARALGMADHSKMH